VITIGVFVVVGILIALKKKNDTLLGRVLLPCVGAFYGAIFGLIVAGMLPSGEIRVVEEDVQSYQLVAFEDTAAVSGSFFLGIGGFDSKAYYIYYYEDESGAIRFDKKRADWDNAAVYEEQRSDAVLRIVERHQEGSMGLWGFDNRSEDDPVYEFHVPEGTVKRSVSLDLSS
jgi:hypothetical protein